MRGAAQWWKEEDEKHSLIDLENVYIFVGSSSSSFCVLFEFIYRTDIKTEKERERANENARHWRDKPKTKKSELNCFRVLIIIVRIYYVQQSNYIVVVIEIDRFGVWHNYIVPRQRCLQHIFRRHGSLLLFTATTRLEPIDKYWRRHVSMYCWLIRTLYSFLSSTN